VPLLQVVDVGQLNIVSKAIMNNSKGNTQNPVNHKRN